MTNRSAARIFIMGVGVAGLQAIATARRLGGIVTATDVRPATKEQVASLGAKFVAVEDEEFKQAQTAAGYAKPMSAEYQKKQAELVASHIKNQDIVVTTALIPGRPAPKLISRAMIESMKPGAVIVDLAAERGGNTELTEPGKTATTPNGVRIFAPLNLAGEVPVNASSLYAKNLYTFLETMIDRAVRRRGLRVRRAPLQAPTHRRRILGDCQVQGRLARGARIRVEGQGLASVRRRPGRR